MVNTAKTDLLTGACSGFQNFIENFYFMYMNGVDLWLMFFNKNREVLDYGRNNHMEMIDIYLKGYEKAKIDMGLIHREKEAANVYF